MPTLPSNQLHDLLRSLPKWTIESDGKSISRSYTFHDFTSAFAFMTHVALHAEKQDHHPDWNNVYNRVEVKLSTHDAGGITEKDIELATFMERIAGTTR